MVKITKASGSGPRKRHTPRGRPKRAAQGNTTVKDNPTGGGLPRKLLLLLANKTILFNDAVSLLDTDSNISEIEKITGLKPGFNWTTFDRDYPHIGDEETTKRYKLLHHLLIISLKSGALESFGYQNGRFERVWISKDDWDSGLSLSYFNTATRYSDHDAVDNVSLINVHLTYENDDKQPGGAPPTYDWNKLLQEWLAEVIENQDGFPQTKKAAYDILIEIYRREVPDDQEGGPSDRMFANKMNEAFPIIWTSIGADKS